MARAAGASFRLGVDTTKAESGLRQFSGKLKNFSSTTKGDLGQIDDKFKGLNATILAGASAITAFGIASVKAMSDFRYEMLQVQYLYNDMEASQRRMLERQARAQQRDYGVSNAAQTYFRLGSTGTPSNQLAAEADPILRMAAALNMDPSMLALSTGQISNLGKISRPDALNLLIATGQASTADVQQLQSLAPGVVSAGTPLGLSAVDSLGLLSGATQVTGTPEEAATGLRAAALELMNKDSKAYKAFKDMFGMSFKDAMEDRGAEGFYDALQMAFDEMGEEEFISMFGRRAGLVMSALATSPIAREATDKVAEDMVGASDRIWEAFTQELPHHFNLLRESLNELRNQMADGAEGGIMSALDSLTNVLNRDDIGKAITAVGQTLGDTLSLLADLLEMASKLIGPLLSLADKDVVGDASVLDTLLFLGAARFSANRVSKGGGTRPPTQRSGAGFAAVGPSLVRMAPALLRGASKVLPRIGRGANHALTALFGLNFVNNAFLGGGDDEESLVDAAMANEFANLVSTGNQNTGTARKLLGATRFKGWNKLLTNISEDENVGDMSTELGTRAHLIGPEKTALLLNELGISESLVSAALGSTDNEVAQEALRAVLAEMQELSAMQARGVAYGEYLYDIEQAKAERYASSDMSAADIIAGEIHKQLEELQAIRDNTDPENCLPTTTNTTYFSASQDVPAAVFR